MPTKEEIRRAAERVAPIKKRILNRRDLKISTFSAIVSAIATITLSFIF